MQGTVSEFDPDTGAGAVLLDDGARLEFPPAAFAASGLRLLRIGQRVRLEYDAQGSDGQGSDGQGSDGQGPDGQGPDGQGVISRVAMVTMS